MRTSPTIWIIGIALAIALIPTMPYGYYPVMRWVVCGACAWTALDAHRRGLEAWVWCWGVLAGIYNPIVSIHSTREIWSVVNIASTGAAILYSFTISRNERRGKYSGAD